MLICIHSVIMEEKNPKLEKQNSFGRNANFYKSHFLIHPKEKEKIKSFSISFYNILYAHILIQFYFYNILYAHILIQFYFYNILYAHILIHRQYWMAMWQWWHIIQSINQNKTIKTCDVAAHQKQINIGRKWHYPT